MTIGVDLALDCLYLLLPKSLVVVDLKTFQECALSFEEAYEEPHFEKSSFRVRKKIFATLNTSKRQAVIKLSPLDQSVFCSYDPAIIYPVTGGWGKQGWTTIELDLIRKDLLLDALTTAYRQVAPKKLGDKYKTEGLE